MNALSSKGFTVHNMRYDFVEVPHKYKSGKHIQRIPALADMKSILSDSVVNGTIAFGLLEFAAICALKGYLSHVEMNIKFDVSQAFTVSSPNGSIAVVAREHDGYLGIYNVIPATPMDWYWLNNRFKKFRHNRAHAEAGSRMQEIHEHQGFLATSMNSHQVWTNERLNTKATFEYVCVDTLEEAGFTVWGQNNDAVPVHSDFK
ncbi:hypothetical protein VPHK436_0024 [Vibrio phage K436]